MRQALFVVGMLTVAGRMASAQTLVPVTHWLVYDDADQKIIFDIQFNRSPDFQSVAGSGAQADSFQFVLDTLPGNNGFGGTSPLPWETVVRGEEIHDYGKIPVRDHVQGPSSAPGSGGWGPIVTLLDFTLSDAHLTFEASYAELNTPDGRFAYEFEIYEQGSWTGMTYAGNTVPAPASAGLLASLAVVARRRRRAHGSHSAASYTRP